MKFTENKEELKKIIAKGNWTVVHSQASTGWTTEILKLTNNGYTVAHEQAERGWVTEDKDILKLSNVFGRTVAHTQAIRGWTTEDKDILVIVNRSGTAIVHLQIDNGWVPPEYLKDFKIKGETLWDSYLEITLNML